MRLGKRVCDQKINKMAVSDILSVYMYLNLLIEFLDACIDLLILDTTIRLGVLSRLNYLNKSNMAAKILHQLWKAIF